MEPITFLSFIIKSSLAIFVVWGLWILALRRINRFAVVRFTIMVGVILAIASPLVVPMFSKSLPQSVATIAAQFSVSVPEVVISRNSNTSTFNWLDILFVSYLSVALIFLFRFLVQLVKIGYLVKKGKCIHNKGITLVKHEKNLPPFSFLTYCFINPNQIPSDKIDVIIQHERAHIQWNHSVDIIILEIVGIFQWFNPFYWMIRRALVELHEYQADEFVLTSSSNQQLYMESIVSLAFNGIALSLGNNFNKSLTLKRLAMMNTKKVGRLAIPALALSFAVAVGTIFTISCSKGNEIEAELETVVTARNLSASTNKSNDETVFVVVEEMPVFDNDETKEFVKFRQYLAKNLRYPEEAAKNGIQGRVFVSFVVDTDGNVTKVKVVRGVEPALDNEAVRVIQSSPKWKPGKQRGENVNVSFTFPIIFVLQ